MRTHVTSYKPRGETSTVEDVGVLLDTVPEFRFALPSLINVLRVQAMETKGAQRRRQIALRLSEIRMFQNQLEAEGSLDQSIALSEIEAEETAALLAMPDYQLSFGTNQLRHEMSVGMLQCMAADLRRVYAGGIQPANGPQFVYNGAVLMPTPVA